MTMHQYLVSNFREMLSILESLRVSRHPGRGMRQLAPRPIIQGSLRTSEASLITHQKDGEFPILLEIELAEAFAFEGRQSETLPLSAVKRVVFQSQKHRDIALHRTFENASFDTLELLVNAKIFDADGEARFSRSSAERTSPDTRWQKADWFCGGVAGALEASRIHPDVRGPAIAQALTSVPVQIMGQVPEQSSIARSTLDTLTHFFAQNSGTGDLYGEELLDSAVAALERDKTEARVLEAFQKRMRAILASDISRKPGELTDEGDIALRALSILIQRPTTVDVLEDRVADEFPGQKVFLTAAFLSGVREGLARLPWIMKAKDAEKLGEIGALIENGRNIGLPISDIIKADVASAGSDRAEAISETNNDVPSRQLGAINDLRFEICSLNSKAAVGRALGGLADMPTNWRIVCDENETLHLTIEMASGDDATAVEAEAKKSILAWKKRTVSKNGSKPNKKELATGSQTLPGLLDQQ